MTSFPSPRNQPPEDATQDGKVAVVFTGANGKLGTMLRRIWAKQVPAHFTPFWQSRRALSDVAADRSLYWDISNAPRPAHWPDQAILVHMAGQTRPEHAQQNHMLLAPLLDAFHAEKARHFIFISTAAVYDFRTLGPECDRKESCVAAPQSAYGQAKLENEKRLQHAFRTCPEALTILRLGNVAGADALFSNSAEPETILDPVPPPFTAAKGPVRSWIGPLSFADALAQIIAKVSARTPLPQIINLAQSPALGMAELLKQSARNWRFGPPNPAVLPRATMDCRLLHSIITAKPCDARSLLGEIAAMKDMT